MSNAAREGYRNGARAVAVGVLGAAVAISVVGCSGSSGTHGAIASSVTTVPAAAGHDRGVTDHSVHGIIGQISAENGSSWTVIASDGIPYSVTITPDTHFGTPQAPRTAQQFPVGSAVHVTGSVTGQVITAILVTASGSPPVASTASTPPAG